MQPLNDSIAVLPTWRQQVSHSCPEDWRHFVMLEVPPGSDGHAIRVRCDDFCAYRFHSRDWTASGLPFVDGRPCWSGYWFENKCDAACFAIREKAFGAICSWDPGFDTGLARYRQRRQEFA